MEFVVERKDFLSALMVGGSMSGKSKVLPILENVKITVKGNVARLSSYDSEVAVTKSTKIVSASEDAAFLVNAKDLMAVLRSISEDLVTFKLEDKIMTVYYSNGQISLPYFDVDEFPTPFVDKKECRELTMSAPYLLKALPTAKKFVHKDIQYFPQFACVCLYFHEKEMGVYGTDKNVACMATNAYEGGTADFNILITPKAVDPLVSMLAGHAEVKITDTDRNVVFSTEDSMLVATKPEALFPPMAFKLFDRNPPIEVEVSREALIGAINRCGITCDSISNYITLSLVDNVLGIQSKDNVTNKSSVESVPCKNSGGDIEDISFSKDYLLLCLSVFSGEKVKLLLENRQTMAIMLDYVKDGIKVALMPFCVV